MGLPEAVNLIANRMEEEAPEIESEGGKLVYRMVKGYISELRTAVQASEPSPGATKLKLFPDGSYLPVGARDLHVEAEKAKWEAEQRSRAEEGTGSRFVEFVGGSMDGTVGPVDSKNPPPEGAKTMMGDELYVFQDGKFCFQEK